MNNANVVSCLVSYVMVYAVYVYYYNIIIIIICWGFCYWKTIHFINSLKIKWEHIRGWIGDSPLATHLHHWAILLYTTGLYCSTPLGYVALRHWAMSLYATGLCRSTPLGYAALRHWAMSLYTTGLCCSTPLGYVPIHHWAMLLYNTGLLLYTTGLCCSRSS